MNASQSDAVANANAHTNNAGLPTYTELARMLEVLVPHVMHYGAMPHSNFHAHRDAAGARALLNRIPA